MSQNVPKTILYVEDDIVVLTAYRKRLEQAGYRVESASDGLEAMKRLTVLAPDVIILDLMMPKVNGVDVMRSILKNPRLQNVPVIVLSTNGLLDGKSDEILASAFRRILKDHCTPAVILETVQQALAPKTGPTLDDSFSSVNF